MNVTRAMIRLLKFCLALLVVMATGCWNSISAYNEPTTSEYTLVLDSLKVLKADEFKNRRWNFIYQMHEGYCKSAFGVEITQNKNKQKGTQIFKDTVAECDKKWLSAKSPIDIPINKEVKVRASSIY